MIVQLINELTELKQAKDLLDEILLTYNVYQSKFDDNPHNKKDLNNKIRDYMKFDDSE